MGCYATYLRIQVASSAIVNMMGQPMDVTKFGIDLSAFFFQLPIVSFVILIEAACLKQETLKSIIIEDGDAVTHLVVRRANGHLLMGPMAYVDDYFW